MLVLEMRHTLWLGAGNDNLIATYKGNQEELIEVRSKEFKCSNFFDIEVSKVTKHTAHATYTNRTTQRILRKSLHTQHTIGFDCNTLVTTQYNEFAFPYLQPLWCQTLTEDYRGSITIFIVMSETR